MANHREMYLALIRSQAEAIEELEIIADKLWAMASALIAAQRKAEEVYMEKGGEGPVNPGF